MYICFMKFRKYHLLYFAILIFSFCGGYAQTDIDKTITVDGRHREYIIHLPTNYQNTTKLPVLFGLHGGGGTDENTIKFYNLNGLADKNGFIVVYPQAVSKSWTIPGFSARTKGADTTVDDVHFISVLLDTIIQYYKGDSTNVFTTGISRGGEFSLYLAYKLSARIKAIAPVCASMPKTVLDYYTYSHPTPVLLINGTHDPLIPYEGGYGKYLENNQPGAGFDMASTDDLVKLITSLNKCGAAPVITDMPDKDVYDGCTATKFTYSCGTMNVILIKVQNGGHTWAGGKQYLPKFMIGNVCRDFNAEDEVFNFFLSTIHK